MKKVKIIDVIASEFAYVNLNQITEMYDFDEILKMENIDNDHLNSLKNAKFYNNCIGFIPSILYVPDKKLDFIYVTSKEIKILS